MPGTITNISVVDYLSESPRMAFGAASQCIILCYNWRNSLWPLYMQNH